MAIKIGGKLTNVLDPNGVIADASQIQNGDKTVQEEVSDIKQQIANVEESIKTVNVTLAEGDLNKLSAAGLYTIALAQHTPDESVSGRLTVIDIDENVIKQIWEASGTYSYRYGNIQEVLDIPEEVYVNDELVEPVEGEIFLPAGGEYTLYGYFKGHITVGTETTYEFDINSQRVPTNAPESGTKLILNGLIIESDREEAILYRPDFKGLDVHLAENSNNILLAASNTKIEDDPSAALSSWNNLTISGVGSLYIGNSYGGHGIKVKDTLKVKGNPYIYINNACGDDYGHDAIHSSKSLFIENGHFKLENCKDGIGVGSSTNGRAAIFGGDFTVSNYHGDAIDCKDMTSNMVVFETSYLTYNFQKSNTQKVTFINSDNAATYFGNGVVRSNNSIVNPTDGIYYISEQSATVTVTGYVNGQLYITAPKVNIELSNTYLTNTNTQGATINYVYSGSNITIKSVDDDIYGEDESLNNVNIIDNGFENINAISSTNNLKIGGKGVLICNKDIRSEKKLAIYGDGNKYFKSIESGKFYIGEDDDVKDVETPETRSVSKEDLYIESITTVPSRAGKEQRNSFYDNQEGTVLIKSLNIPLEEKWKVFDTQNCDAFIEYAEGEFSNLIDSEGSEIVVGNWVTLSETPELDLSEYAKLEDLSQIKAIKTYSDIDLAKADLPNLDVGLIISVGVGATDDKSVDDNAILNDYKPYMVVVETNGNKGLKEISSGSANFDSGTLDLTITKIKVNDTVFLDTNSFIECPLKSTITVYYTFISSNYPDIRGKVGLKQGGTILNTASVYPKDGEEYSMSYTLANQTPGEYTLTLLGVESTNKQVRKTFKIRVGTLTVETDNLKDKTVFKAGEDINFRTTVVSGNTTSHITQYILVDDVVVSEKTVAIGTVQNTIPASANTKGRHTIKIYLTEQETSKKSNELEITIISAVEGELFASSGKSLYRGNAGSRITISLIIIELNKTNGVFPTTLTILDSNNELVTFNNRTSVSYNLAYGENTLQLIGLEPSNIAYTAVFNIESETEGVDPIRFTVPIKIDENIYDIDSVTDGLVCWFDAKGKTNNSIDRDTWEDKSPDTEPNTIKKLHTRTVNGETVVDPYISFNNFAWGDINGWLEDSDGNTALNLNSGAYVEVDLAPFENEVTDAMTISVDFSTEDILDSEAKVVSCLYETDGQDEEVFYLRDAFGDYIKRDNDNIVNYFKYAGGYCWIDGETYPAGTIGRLANGDLPYEVTYSASERTQNYNAGEVNPYGPNGTLGDGTDLRNYTGTTYNAVTKQRGFYIDTQYAVLSNSSSMADPEKKFHLNFSSNTRTKIDLIILRNPNNNTYYFPAMIGYINGVLSLFKTIDSDTTNDKFIHESNNGTKYKIYFGCKAKPNEYGRGVTVSNTGSSKLYSFKIYNRALTPDEILRNYAAEIPDNATIVTEDGRTVNKKEFVIDNNGILNKDTMAKLPELCLIGANMSAGSTPDYSINYFIMQLSDVEGSHVDDLKAVKLPAYLRYTDPNNDNNSWYNVDSDGHRTDSLIPIRLQFQGTSSMVYSSKNFKFKLYEKEGFDPVRRTYGKKVKRDIGNGVEENSFVIKVDFIDSSHCMNTQNANFIADYNELTGTTPAMALNSKVRTTVYGKPVLLYYQEHDGEDVQRHFLGIANLNTDKSDNDSLGLKKNQPDNEGIEHNFGQPMFIDDNFTNDILVKTDQKIRLYDAGDQVEKEYTALKDPATNEIVAVLSEKGFLRTINNDKLTNVMSAEIKANSGASGAAGFGNYSMSSLDLDFEMRYPDQGDIENDEDGEYHVYLADAKENDQEPISFRQFKHPYLYHLRRLIKWVKTANKEEFNRDFDLHFNRNYLVDYYLTFLFLGAVDSLGKNLMIQTHGPENHLYQCSEDFASTDHFAFKYTCTDGSEIYITPTVNKSLTDRETNQPMYKYAEDSDGRPLFYEEKCFSRVTQTFKPGYSSFIVTKVPGECIWYPTYYDIDTASGLDNSGQLLYDVDIEMGDQLSDGTTVYNTDDSHLWSKVNTYLKEVMVEGSSILSHRWSILRQSKFTVENLVEKFYYGRSISKIPEKYYNDDAFIKYIWEGPFKPGELIGSSDVAATKGSGTYLYCIHGSRYEQMKRWFSQRLYYLDSYFGKIGTDNASLRFNYQKADPNYAGTDNYYENYALLAEEYPNQYIYDAETNSLKSTTGVTIEPIKFQFKTYQPGYVGVRWFNNDKIHTARVGRGKVAEIIGNVKTTGDAEVFIFGGENIKEIGNMAPYNVKQVDFKNLKKLNKLILGDSEHYPNISKLDLGVNSYLTELSLVNCTSLNTVNVGNCRNLKTLRMEGSGISSVTLPEGGALENISYSSAISSIKLNNFISLSNITVPSNLANLTTLIIKNCPKILGSKTAPTARAWSILQLTRTVSALSDIQLESYGAVEPVMLTDGSEWFFLDKYYNTSTSKKIKGEIYYRGSSVPTNYTKFATSYPELKVTYDNISDASEMFANFNNINLIGTIKIYAGEDDYGNPKYRDVKYWVDSDPDIREKWHNAENFSRYRKTTDAEYDASALFYESGNETYRLLDLYDEEDLDNLRAEIKEHLSKFSKFTNVKGMFKGDYIIDYLDPDTFNNIDLSEANTDEMFAGCTNLEYFEVPSDVVKNTPEIVYLDGEGNIIDDISGITPEVLEGLDSKVMYRNPFDNKKLIEDATSIYRKGMRSIGSKMFYNCKKLRFYLKKLPEETMEKITIAEDAFEYECFDDTKETQGNKVTFQRPAIFFEYTPEELLKLVDDETSTFVGFGEDGEDLVLNNPASEISGKYFSLTKDGEREISFTNSYITFTSPAWLREVYFDIRGFVFDEDYKDGEFNISYAYNGNNEKILTKVIQNVAQSQYFNYETTDNNNYFRNPLNIISYCQESLMGIKKVIIMELPLQTYDCLDITKRRFPEEYSITGAFTDKLYTLDKTSTFQTASIEDFLIVNNEVIYESALRGLNFKRVGIGPSIKEVKSLAFSEMKSLQNVVWFNYNASDSNGNTGILSGRWYDVYYGTGNDNGNAGPTTIQLRKLGDSVFEKCISLSSIYIPKTVSEMGDRCFAGCTSLRFVRYSNRLTTIPDYTFYECENLTITSPQQDAYYSDAITYIGNFAFAKCTNLDIFRRDGGINFEPAESNLNFAYFSHLSFIGNNAFQDTAGLIPQVSTFDGERPVNNASYKLYLPETLSYIGDNAFYKEAKANEVNENGVIELDWNRSNSADYSSLIIGGNAFYNIRFAWSPTGEREDLLKDVIFIPKITSIGRNAFYAASEDCIFRLVLTTNSESSLNADFVNIYKKMIFNYKGILFDFTAGDTGAALLRGQFILGERELQNGDMEPVAYLQKSTSNISIQRNSTESAIYFPRYITDNNIDYKLIEVLSGAFDNYNDYAGGISMIWFGYQSELEHIETEVFTKDNATSLYNIFSQTGVNASDYQADIIPSQLIIDTGNDLSAWVGNQTRAGFITLGRYIFSYRNVNENNEVINEPFALDFTDPSVSQCDIIYDNAFKGLPVYSVLFSNDIKYIYKSAFEGTNLDYSTDENPRLNLPSNILRIETRAFAGVKIRELYFPRSLEYIGKDAFKESDTTVKGSLRYVEFEDGCEAKGYPFVVQKEITTGNNTVPEANVTMQTMRVPSSMAWVLSSKFDQLPLMSQLKYIYAGNLERHNGSIMVPNIPLYIQSDGSAGIDYSETPLTSDLTGEQLYCYKFMYDLYNSIGVYTRYAEITTTEPASPCPIGDDTVNNIPGIVLDKLDLTTVRQYDGYIVNAAIGNDEALADIRKDPSIPLVNVLMLAAGCSKTAGESIIYVDQAMAGRLSPYIFMIKQRANVRFEPKQLAK